MDRETDIETWAPAARDPLGRARAGPARVGGLDGLGGVGGVGRHSANPPRERAGRHARAGSRRPGRRRRVAVLLVCLLAVALAVAGEAARSWTEDDGPPAARSRARPAGRPVTTAPPGTGAPRSGRPAALAPASARAVVELADELMRRAGASEGQARCTARRTVSDAGLDRLVRVGILSPHGRFRDPEIGHAADVRRALRAAAEACR